MHVDVSLVSSVESVQCELVHKMSLKMCNEVQQYIRKRQNTVQYEYNY